MYNFNGLDFQSGILSKRFIYSLRGKGGQNKIEHLELVEMCLLSQTFAIFQLKFPSKETSTTPQK